MKILIIVDYRNQFYSSIRSSTVGFRLNLVEKYFKEKNIELKIVNFNESLYIDNINDYIVLYQSSEDKNLFYKSYIFDVMQYHQSQGIKIIPCIDFFNAHHNKLYQELLLKKIRFENCKVLESRLFGTFEDLVNLPDRELIIPCVIKGASGCTSKSVYLAKNKSEVIKFSKKVSDSFDLFDFLRFKYKKIFKHNYINESSNRNKFIHQSFVPNLEGDYKVLVYGDKFYILERKNRKNDFRASGSGIFNYPEKAPIKILDAAKEIFEKFNTPYVSLDLAYDKKNDEVYLIEYQFMMFGTYTLEKSNFYYIWNKEWQMINGKSEIENEFVNAVVLYLNKIK